MGFFDLFKSKADADKESKRQRRRTERNAERAVENIQEKNSALVKECNQLWEKARKELLSGQKSAAAVTLKHYKAKMVMVSRNERTFIMARNNMDMMNNAALMQEMGSALKDLAVVSNVDPDRMAENMDAIDDVTDDVRETNRLMEKGYERSIAQIDKDLENSADLIGDDELMKVLETETAGAILGPKVAEENSGIPTEADINSGRDTLNRLLNI